MSKTVQSDAEAQAIMSRLSLERAAYCQQVYKSWREVGWVPHDALDLTLRIPIEKGRPMKYAWTDANGTGGDFEFINGRIFSYEDFDRRCTIYSVEQASALHAALGRVLEVATRRSDASPEQNVIRDLASAAQRQANGSGVSVHEFLNVLSEAYTALAPRDPVQRKLEDLMAKYVEAVRDVTVRDNLAPESREKVEGLYQDIGSVLPKSDPRWDTVVRLREMAEKAFGTAG